MASDRNFSVGVHFLRRGILFLAFVATLAAYGAPARLAVPSVSTPNFFDGPPASALPLLPDGTQEGFLNESPYSGETVEGRDCGKVFQIIATANEAFRRLSWPPSFIAGRQKVAKDYARRSNYYRIRSLDKSGWKTDITHTTIGETHARFRRSTIEAMTPQELLAHRRFLIPMEETLQTLVTRYYDSKGRGIVLEFRANSKRKGTPDNIRKQMLVKEIQLAMEAVRDYPELYEKPIIYTYADEAHRRLYRAYGFEVQEKLTPLDKPIVMVDSKTGKKTNWWVLAVTPKRLEANLFELTGARTITGLNQPHPVTLPNGRTAFAAPGSTIDIDANAITTGFVPTEDLEIAPGLSAAAGSTVRWNHDEANSVYRPGVDAIGFIQKTSAPYTVKIKGGAFTLPAGSQITFHQGTEPATWSLGGKMHFEEGKATPRDLNGNPLPWEIKSTRPFSLPGTAISVASGSTLYFDESVLMIHRIAHRVDLGHGIFAAAGSSLGVAMKRGRYEWRYIMLERDVIINGFLCKAKSVLERDDGGNITLQEHQEGPEYRARSPVPLGKLKR